MAWLRGGEYVDVSSAVLIFVSRGYFASANCMRELLRAVLTGKPLISMLEPEAIHGALSLQQIKDALRDAENTRYERWGLLDEVAQWSQVDGTSLSVPGWSSIYESLTNSMLVEWNRIGPFQDVTVRLIAQRLISGETQRRRQLLEDLLLGGHVEAMGRYPRPHQRPGHAKSHRTQSDQGDAKFTHASPPSRRIRPAWAGLHTTWCLYDDCRLDPYIASRECAKRAELFCAPPDGFCAPAASCGAEFGKAFGKRLGVSSCRFGHNPAP